jgi:hypothetical protein
MLATQCKTYDDHKATVANRRDTQPPPPATGYKPPLPDLLKKQRHPFNTTDTFG